MKKIEQETTKNVVKKRPIMLRTSESERIEQLKKDFKFYTNQSLTTEDIFNKGLEVFEKVVSDKKISFLISSEISNSQASIIQSGIKRGLKVKYITPLSNTKFKDSQLIILVDYALTDPGITKMALLANPNLKTSQIGQLVGVATNFEVGEDLLEIFATPNLTPIQVEMIWKGLEKNVPKETLVKMVDPNLTLEKIENISKNYLK